MTWNPSLIYGPVEGFETGYHLNIAKALMTPALAAFEVAPDPETPAAVFAGDTLDEDGAYQLTAFLLFDDETHARAQLPGLWLEPEPEGE